MLSFAQAEALKAEKRAALASQWKKPEAKVLDGSALDGLKLVTNESGEDDGLDFGATGVKSKRERTKNSAAKQTLDVSFRVAPAEICFIASALFVKIPVHSNAMSTSFHGRFDGSLSAVTLIRPEPTSIFPSTTFL